MIEILDDAVILVTMSLSREHSCIYIFSADEFKKPDEYLSELYARSSIKQITKESLPFYLNQGYGLSVSANAYSVQVR
ncbi:hypothetical protein WAX88_01270 [Photobacterium damselae subsp. damselae]|uniref:hypothetical protein n=1 Tax=Photobacterium damselae TaxID=38293 RepID=UPI00311AF2B3